VVIGRHLDATPHTSRSTLAEAIFCTACQVAVQRHARDSAINASRLDRSGLDGRQAQLRSDADDLGAPFVDVVAAVLASHGRTFQG
jgi:hypothetical protein